MNSFSKLALAVGLPAAMLAGPAAAGIVNKWSYEVNAGFTTFTQNPCIIGPGGVTNAECTASSVTGSNNDTVDGDSIPTRLSWGVPVTASGQSSLSVTTDITGNDLETNNAIFTDGAKLTHNNFRQKFGGHNLATTTLRTQLILVPFDPAIPTTNENLVAEFDINFRETRNNVTCPAGDPFPATPCSDIFTVDPASLPALIRHFVFNGFNYTVEFQVDGLGPLQPAQCAAAGAAAGCIGFVTEEDRANNFQGRFRISAEEIPLPEPTSLALLGLSMVGLGVAGRVRKNSK